MHEDLHTLMAETGVVVEATECIEFDDDSWLFSFDDDVDVYVELDHEREILVLNANLGTPPPGMELDLYRLLLQAGTAWRETHGIHMSLDPIDDTVLQIQELPVHGLDSARMSERLLAFAETARNASQIITEFGEESTSPQSLSLNLA